MSWERPDVLVIGGGAAAATAALEASKNCNVMMISKDRVLGGASIQASGGISLPGAAGEELELFVEDTIRSGEGLNNRDLVRVLAREGSSFIKFLEGMGVVFDQDQSGKYRILKKTEGHSVMRNYNDRRMFHEFGRVLKANLCQSNVRLMEHCMVFGLCTDEGRVIGCIAYSLEEGKFIYIVPRAIVLASGGYGRVYGISDNATTLTGECHSMALECGAELMDMEMVQFIPLSFPFPKGMKGTFIGMCSLFGPGVKLYNGLCERFMSRYVPEKQEYGTRDQVARGIFREIQAGRGTERGTIIVDPTGNDPKLLQQYRLSTPTVYKALERIFGEKAARWEAPFEAVPSQHFCMGGVRIDIEGRTSCRNLFAAGEVTAGVHGGNRLGGNALTEAVVFGKIAGRSASEEACNKNIPPESRLKDYFTTWQFSIDKLICGADNSKDVLSGCQLKEAIGKIMWDCGGIVRNDYLLNEGISRLEKLKEQSKNVKADKGSKWNYSLVEALEARHMLRVGEAILKSALLRTESRGAHFRDDFPEINPALKANIITSLDEDSQLMFEIKPVSQK